MKTRTASFNTLPEEIQVLPLSYLNFRTRKSVSSVAKNWHRLVNDDYWARQLGFEDEKTLKQFLEIIKEPWLKKLFLDEIITKEQLVKVNTIFDLRHNERTLEMLMDARIITEEEIEEYSKKVGPLNKPLHTGKGRILLEDICIKTLLEKHITFEDFLSIPHIHEKSYALYAFDNGLITREQMESIPKEYAEMIFSFFGYVVLSEKLILLETMLAMPKEHLKAFLLNPNIQQAVKLGHLGPKDFIQARELEEINKTADKLQQLRCMATGLIITIAIIVTIGIFTGISGILYLLNMLAPEAIMFMALLSMIVCCVGVFCCQSQDKGDCFLKKTTTVADIENDYTPLNSNPNPMQSMQEEFSTSASSEERDKKRKDKEQDFPIATKKEKGFGDVEMGIFTKRRPNEKEKTHVSYSHPKSNISYLS